MDKYYEYKKLYPHMPAILKPDSLNNFAIDHFMITSDNLKALKEGILPGIYVRLLGTPPDEGRWIPLMSDTPMELVTNAKFVRQAHGDILIAGLGLGMIVLPVQDSESVNSITIIEKEADIIKLITKQISFSSKVKIVKADIFNYRPKERFDVIYLDIWSSANKYVYKNEMIPLMKIFRKYLKRDKKNEAWIGCWGENDAKEEYLAVKK